MQYVPNGPVVLDTLADPLVHRLCRIVTVKPYTNPCPAELALASEGIELEVTAIEESCTYEDNSAYLYVQHLARCWDDGEQFINLEHDVVPWHGALEELWRCCHPWCRFQYPIFPAPRLSNGIGCMKFGKEILAGVGCDDWLDLAWWDLDGQIISSVKGAGHAIHDHFPCVAHVRRPNGLKPSELK